MRQTRGNHQTVVVTGAAGYLGAVLCHRLLDRGATVRGVDSIRYHGDALLGLLRRSGFEFHRLDVRQTEPLAAVLEGADAVVHLAALVGEPVCRAFPEEARAVNQEASRTLAEASRKRGIGHFVFASTCSNYGKSPDHGWLTEDDPLRPLSLYSETKIAAEDYLMRSGSDRFRTVVLRFATLFGLSPAMRFDLLVQEFVRDAACASEMMVYGADAWRPFLHVEDAAEAIVRVLIQPPEAPSTVFNVGDNALNCRKGELARLVLEEIPRTRLVETMGIDDPRDYRVSFERFQRSYDFHAKRTLRQGIQEIARLIRDGIIQDPYNSRYNKVETTVSKK